MLDSSGYTQSRGESLPLRLGRFARLRTQGHVGVSQIDVTRLAVGAFDADPSRGQLRPERFTFGSRRGPSCAWSEGFVAGLAPGLRTIILTDVRDSRSTFVKRLALRLAATVDEHVVGVASGARFRSRRFCSRRACKGRAISDHGRPPCRLKGRRQAMRLRFLCHGAHGPPRPLSA